MSAKPRDLLKTRRQRIGEVYMALHEKTGAFDIQVVSFGGNLAVGGTNTTIGVDATEYVIGQAVVNKAATATLAALPAGATTDASTFRKVLVQIDSAGTVTYKVGNGVSTAQADAVKPAPDTGKIELGWIEVPQSFTAGTTAVTSGMLKKTAYWGNA